MGERLANEAAAIIKQRRSVIPDFEEKFVRLATGGSVKLEDFVTMTLHSTLALQEALIYVARSIEDPEAFGAAVVEAAKESLKRDQVTSEPTG